MYQPTNLTTLDRWAIAVAMGWFLMFGTVSAFVTHSFTFFPDSRQHHQYIKVLLSGQLPHLTAQKIHQEEHQPPLYYITAAPALLLGERFGIEGGVVLVRLWTLLIGSGVILVTTLLARQLAPRSTYLPAVAALIVGLNPQFYVMSAEVNNDALASLLGGLLLLYLVRFILGWRAMGRSAVIFGLVLAAAWLTKMSLWPLVGVTVVVAAVQHRRQRRTLTWMVVPVVIAAGWWLTRNTLEYGDPFVMQKFQEYWGAEQHQSFLTPSGIWTWLTLLFETYWARYRHFTAGMHYQTYAALKISVVAALSGLAVFLATSWRKMQPLWRWAYAAVFGCIAMVAAGVFMYSLRFYQPQGRYLFPVQAAIAFFLALGLDALAPERYKRYVAATVFVGLVLLNMAALRVVVYSG